jgi:hypothetical protein
MIELIAKLIFETLPPKGDPQRKLAKTVAEIAWQTGNSSSNISAKASVKNS